MVASELRIPDLDRVRWLCTVSEDTASQLCSDANVSDPPELHCARFALHLTMNVALPEGYAWQVFRSWEHSKGWNVYRAPLEAHVRMMAICAVDFDQVQEIPVKLWTERDPFLQPLALLRLARSPGAINDECLLDLSHSESEDTRRAVARLLAWRQSSYRKEILIRLMDDPRRSVSGAASAAAARTKEPELLDVLASKRDLFSLNLVGDPRGRPRIEALVSSDYAGDCEEGVSMALNLKDRDLLVRLWNHPDWDSRLQAILGSARQGLLDPPQVDEILARESADHVVELLLHWPHNDTEVFLKMAGALRNSVEGFPNSDALVEGRAEVLDRARSWSTTNPGLGAAIIRLIPNDSAVRLAKELLASPEPGPRVAAIKAVARCQLIECYPRVAELCLDPDEVVAKAAADAVWFGGIRCGVYGLDTAILKAGDDFRASVSQRSSLSFLIKAILLGKA